MNSLLGQVCQELEDLLEQHELEACRRRMAEIVAVFEQIISEGEAEDASFAEYLEGAKQFGYRLAARETPLDQVLGSLKRARGTLMELLYLKYSDSMTAFFYRLFAVSSRITDLCDQILIGYQNRRQDEVALSYELQRRQVLDALPVTVVVYDEEERCVFANAEALRGEDVTEEQVVGRKRQILAELHNRRGEPADAWQRAMSGERVSFRMERIGEDGLTLNDKEMIPLLDGNGRPNGVVMVTSPLVSEKERLINLQKQFSFVLNSMNNGLLVVNQDFIITAFNNKAEEIFGVTADQVLGRDLRDGYASFMAAGAQAFDRAFPRFSRLHPVRNHVRTMELRDRTVILRFDGNPIRNANDEAVGYVLMAEDLTELSAMREAMARNEKFALIGQFAAGIAHEIRNPLTTVNGFLQLYAAGSTPPEQFLDLTQNLLLSELERANSILSDFLMISRPTAPKRTPVETRRFLEEVVRLIESEAILKNVLLRVEAPAELPGLMLDVQQMKQVFLNLCKNAFDVTQPGGTLTLRVSVAEERVTFDVIDEGPGIAEPDLSRIFEPFFTTKSQGTGLGLPISHRIVEGHAGRLEVRSAEGVGTTFSIRIPVMEEARY